MKKLFLLTYILLNLFECFSQNGIKRCGIDFPTTVCESEELNGDITLTWKKPSDPQGVFLKYELFSKEAPYVPISSSNNISNTSITIPSSFNGNNFFLVTTTLCNNIQEKFYSDTSTLTQLNAVKIDEGIEQLSWTDNPILTNKITYIERKTEIGQWVQIDSVLFNKKGYLDTVDICNRNKLLYRIGTKKDGCTNYSMIISDTLKDSYHPNTPTIVAVGFDTSNQNLILSWKKGKERDIQGYIIYQEINGLSSTLDTIFTIGNKIDTSFTIFNPSISKISNYRVAAFDYCYSVAPKFQTSAQSKAFQTTVISNTYNVCSNELTLNWNKIITDDEIKSFKILIKKNNEKWQIVDSTNQTFYKTILSKYCNYSFAIKSLTNNGYQFYSNIINQYSKAPSEPKISYTNYASVSNDNSQIEIKHTISPTTGIPYLALFRLNDFGVFEEIDKKNAGLNEIIFVDNKVDPTRKSYQYYIQHIDSCGNYTFKSKKQKTILLLENAKNEDSLTSSIKYNSYQGMFGNINQYIIEKYVDNQSPNFIDETIFDSVNIYNDKIDSKDNFEGKICYKIRAVENTNIYKIQSTSYSNSICLYYQPKIFIPNSFTPKGNNPVFKPIVSFSQIENYNLTIFNRWGQPVFVTTNINEGWDGKYGTDDCPNGLYIYQLKINSGSDKEIIKRGLVNLIK